MRHRQVNDLYNPIAFGVISTFSEQEKKLLVMTSKCIKLRICTLLCCSETHCLNYKYDIKVEGKIKTNKHRDLENQG